MNTYEITFNGRVNGSQGVITNKTTTVKAENKQRAELKLYEKYEHISNLKIEKV